MAACGTQFRKSKQSINLSFNVPFTESSETTPENFTIEGVAINSITTSNNHKFLVEELEPSAKSLNGVPLLKDHDNSVDSVIGRVLKGKFNAEEGNVIFKALIDPDNKEIQRKINRGLLNSVSIGADIREIEEGEDGELIPRGIIFRELSIVAVPADAGATFGFALKEAYNKIKEDDVDDLVDDVNEEEEKEAKELLNNTVITTADVNSITDSGTITTLGDISQSMDPLEGKDIVQKGGETQSRKMTEKIESTENKTEVQSKEIELSSKLEDISAKLEAQTELVSKLLAVKEEVEKEPEEKEEEETKVEQKEEEKSEEKVEDKPEDEEVEDEVSEGYNFISGQGSINGQSFEMDHDTIMRRQKKIMASLPSFGLD